MTARLAIIMPTFPKASREVRVREFSVMLISKVGYDVQCQIVTFYDNLSDLLYGSVETVAGVTQPWHYVALVVKALILTSNDDSDVVTIELRL